MKKEYVFLLSVVLLLGGYFFNACTKDTEINSQNPENNERPEQPVEPVIEDPIQNDTILVALASLIPSIQGGATGEVYYEIKSEIEPVTIEVFCSKDITSKIEIRNGLNGTITLTASSDINENSYVSIFAHNGKRANVSYLLYKNGSLSLEAEANKEWRVSSEGETLILPFFTGMQYVASVSEEDQQWIKPKDEPRAFTIEKYAVGASERTGEITLTSTNSPNLYVTYCLAQDACHVWADNAVPPDDEIWYISKYKCPCLYIDSRSNRDFDYGCAVISNTYENGMGVLKCSGPIRRMDGGAIPDEIEEILLPDCVEYIGTHIQSSSIESFRIPRSLKSINLGIFSPRIRFFKGYHISNDGHLLILDNAVYASALNGEKSCSIPEGVFGIEPCAFANCTTLESIRLPESLKYIKEFAFTECYKLTGDVYIPNGLVEMAHQDAFHRCYFISSFSGNSRFVTSDHRCLLNDEGLIICFAGKDLESYSIPEGVIGIAPYGMLGAVKLKKLFIPQSLEFVSSSSFNGGYHDGYDCSELSTFEGYHVSSDSMGIVLDSAFYGEGCLACVVPNCPAYYTIPRGIKCLDCCFNNNDKVETIVCDDEITSIREAFSSCGNLKQVVLPQNLLKFIDGDPFYLSDKLESIYFRSYVPPAYPGGKLAKDLGLDINHDNVEVFVPNETLEVYLKAPDMEPFRAKMKGYNFTDIVKPDYYVSTDYSQDGKVTLLQQSSKGAGINVIIMGDAFSDRQIADGTYASAMQKTYNAFFLDEPYKSYRDYFNVYAVTVVSVTEGYDHQGQRLGSFFGDETLVGGYDNIVIRYAQEAVSDALLDEATVIVVMNKNEHSGTCYMYTPEVLKQGDYGWGMAIAYIPLCESSFSYLVTHEAGGHGFGKLADEYITCRFEITEEKLANYNAVLDYGWNKNVDLTSDLSKVKWSQFIGDSRYSAEKIGCYEGGYTFEFGVWRPTENSAMNSGIDGFNAPSRYAIWRRINKLAYGDNWNGTYEDFVAYDAVNRTPVAVARREEAIHRRMVERPLPPTAPPVIVSHSWRDDK